MTHKQQADELIKKFLPYANPNSGEANWNSAKKCALIAVELILNAIPDTVPAEGYGSAQFKNPDIGKWQAVKAEIEKL